MVRLWVWFLHGTTLDGLRRLTDLGLHATGCRLHVRTVIQEQPDNNRVRGCPTWKVESMCRRRKGEFSNAHKLVWSRRTTLRRK
jgi:hypothetical protein